MSKHTAEPSTTTLPLPRDLGEFRSLARACRTDEQSFELADRVLRDFAPKHIRDRLYRLAIDTRSKQYTLCEDRLFELASQFSGNKNPVYTSSGFGLAWYYLIRMRSPRFAMKLRTIIATRRGKQRFVAIECLAYMAFRQDFTILKSMFRSENWTVRGAIAKEWGVAAHHKRFSAADVAHLMNWLVPAAAGQIPISLTARDGDGVNALIDGIAYADSRRAFLEFTSRQVLHPKNRAIFHIMRKLDSMRELSPHWFKRPIDPNLLWPIYEAIVSGRLHVPSTPKNRVKKSRETTALILSFTALGDPSRTAQECRKLLRDPAPDGYWGQDLAKAALKQCRGIADTSEVFSRFQHSARGFSARATNVLRILEMIDHCITDGLPLYFSNLGEHWHEAAEGLKILKITKPRALLLKAGNLYEAIGAEQFRRQFAREWKSNGALIRKLDSIDTQLERTFPSIRAAVNREIAKHSEVYRSKPTGKNR